MNNGYWEDLAPRLSHLAGLRRVECGNLPSKLIQNFDLKAIAGDVTGRRNAILTLELSDNR